MYESAALELYLAIFSLWAKYYFTESYLVVI